MITTMVTDADEALIAAFYRGAVDEPALASVLHRLAERFGCRGAALLSIDVGRPGADIEIGIGVVDAASRRRYREAYAAEDPAPAAMARLPVGTATATDRLFSPAFKAASRFVHEFYRPLGLDETLGGPLVNGDGRYAVLAVQRGFDRPAFTDEEIAAFERFMPHAAQMIALRRAFFDLRRKADDLSGALDAAPTATMVFDGSGVLDHANAAARLMLAREDGLRLTRVGRLVADDLAADARLRAAFAAPGPAVLRAPRIDGTSPYVLHLAAASQPRGRLVRVCDPSASGDATDLLRQALDLSPPSARLVAALMAGQDIAGHAARAGLSVNTAKYHLKAAFAATGTRRQADLVRLAAAVARDLASPG